MSSDAQTVDDTQGDNESNDGAPTDTTSADDGAATAPQPTPSDNDANDTNGSNGTGGSDGAGENDTEKRPSMGQKRFSVSETPQWRFIAKAKKAEGYSSAAAGSVVKGKEF